MSLRQRLLAMALLPLGVVLPLLVLALLVWGSEAFDRLLVTKVRSDLAVAQGYFERVLGELGTGTSAIAESHALQLVLASPHGGDPVALLRQFKARAKVDFVNLRDPDGTLRFTDSGPATDTDSRSPAFTAAVEAVERTGVELLQPAQLAPLGPELRNRVVVPLVATRNAAPTGRTHEERALVLLATRAVRAPDGRVLGQVQAGVLLNRNLAFIDHINEIVYPEGSLPFGSRGTATLFLGDVRVSTNVRLFGAEKDERAIGTRVSQQVADAVLGQGATWLGRAFVVSDWYVSAYQPLADSHGERVGMLYVGILERPFTLIKWGVLAAIGAIFAAVMAGAAYFSLKSARAIFDPVERMEATMRRVEDGMLAARVGPVAGGDELARLAAHFDRLLATQQGWHEALDAKVAERTQQLEDTQAQLVRSEKLATVGQLTASIAHEVNNPIAVIQGNLDLVRELLDRDAAARVAPELKLVDEQIGRMRLIVTQLLQFAKPSEFAGYVEAVDPARALEDCLVLVAHLLARTRIAVQRAFAAKSAVSVNRQELQQVLVNLLVNAIHAMEGGGTLHLSTREAEGGWVEIAVGDTGPGLAPEVLANLFQPFVTHKKDGTGLGLWISRGIVERYCGDIVAGAREGGGAVFTVRLKAEAAAA